MEKNEIQFTQEQLTALGLPEDIKTPDEAFAQLKTLLEKPEPKPYEFADDFIKEAVQFYNTSGTLDPYLKAHIDYSKKSPEELIRLSVKKENEGLSNEAINILTNEKLKEFAIDEKDSDDQKKLKSELFKVTSEKIAKQLSDESKKFIAPEKPSPKAGEWVKTVKENPLTGKLLSEKNVPIKYGDEEFFFEIDEPDKMVERTIDSEKFFKMFKDDRDRKSTRLNSSHIPLSRMPSSA